MNLLCIGNLLGDTGGDKEIGAQGFFAEKIAIPWYPCVRNSLNVLQSEHGHVEYHGMDNEPGVSNW